MKTPVFALSALLCLSMLSAPLSAQSVPTTQPASPTPAVASATAPDLSAMGRDELQTLCRNLFAKVDDLRNAKEYAEKKLNESKSEVKKLKEQVASLQAKLDSAQTDLSKSKPFPPSDKIADAIKHHQLVVGMTQEQIKQSVGSEGKKQGEIGNMEEWDTIATVPSLHRKGNESYVWHYTLENGKVTSCRIEQ